MNEGLEANMLFSRQILLVVTEGKALYHALHHMCVSTSACESMFKWCFGY